MKKLLSLIGLLSLCSCLPTQYSSENETELEFADTTERGPASFADLTFTSSELRVGDRLYISSVFKSVFGPAFNNSNLVYNNVVRKQPIFGGNCDRYEVSYKGATSKTPDNPWANCFDANWNTKPIVKSTTLREGWRVRTCELMVRDNPTAVSYALNKARVPASTNPNRDSLNNIYKLFFPIENLPSDTMREMLTWAEQFDSNKEFWESSLLAFCITPTWQIP